MKINFIGGGNMTQAIINGLINNSFEKNDIHVMEIDPAQRSKLQSELQITTSNAIDMGEPSIVILAVKPNQIQSVCKSIQSKINSHLIISIAAGVKIIKISDWLGGHSNIIRGMPNIGAKIQKGITALYADDNVSIKNKELTSNILKAIGKVIWVDNEGKMDAVTALSGSGPAYVFMFISALIEAGQKIGLTRGEAESLAYTTLHGSTLLSEHNLADLDNLIKNVTSKGGTTEQGIKTLNENNFKKIILLATEAAFNRAKEIGSE